MDALQRSYISFPCHLNTSICRTVAVNLRISFLSVSLNIKNINKSVNKSSITLLHQMLHDCNLYAKKMNNISKQIILSFYKIMYLTVISIKLYYRCQQNISSDRNLFEINCEFPGRETHNCKMCLLIPLR